MMRTKETKKSLTIGNGEASLKKIENEQIPLNGII